MQRTHVSVYSSQKREKLRKAFIESLGDWKNIHIGDRYGEIEMNLFRLGEPSFRYVLVMITSR